MADVVAWFNSLGWVANALGIGIPLATGVGILFNRRRELFGVSEAVIFVKNNIMPYWDENSAKGIVEIAIVDDNQVDFPVAELKKANYKLKGYKQVSLSDIQSLAKYDIVFLDMHGIVKDDPKNGGLILIGKLRDANRYQKICAVSSKTFDPSATAFFKKADDVQDKPINAQKCQEVIDTFANEKISPLSIANLIDDHIAHLQTSKRRLLFSGLLKNASENKDMPDFAKIESLFGKIDNDLKWLLTDLYRMLIYAVH